MKVYGRDNVKYSSEKEVLGWLEKVKTKNLDNKISFGFANINISPRLGRDRELDFILIGKSGIFVLEVKGGGVTIRDGQWISVDWKNTWNKIHNPFKQAQDNYYELIRVLQKNGINISNKDGYFASVFNDIQVKKPLDPSWPVEMYFDYKMEYDPEKYINALIDYKDKKFKSSNLDTKIINKIKKQLAPNYKEYIRDITSSSDDKIILLSEEQNIAFESLSSVKRMVIDGPPGSGKTILALEQLIYNEHEGIDTLYVCYNRALRNKIAYEVQRRFVYDPLHISVLTVAMASSLNRQYDYLVLDEGQDYLNTKELENMGNLLKGGLQNGKFRIYLDLNQDVFDASDKEAIKKILDRDDVVHYPLKYNYRNTSKILEYVKIMTPHDVGKIRNNPEGTDVEICQIPYKGLRVDYDKYPKALAEKVNELLKSGVEPKEIMIVSISGGNSSVMSERNRSKMEFINNVRVSLGREIQWEKYEKTNTIIFGNSYDLKGLDSKIVICTDVFTKADRERTLLVGLTRARSRLIVFKGRKVE
jgi:hypothetical protein